jgi:hypothetical protein
MEQVTATYESVDGNTYTEAVADKFTDTGQLKARTSYGVKILLHAFSEMIKGGDPLMVLGSYGVVLQDQEGNVAMNFPEAMDKVYADKEATGVEGEDDDNLDGVTISID